jgi:fimbrial chaperone protein
MTFRRSIMASATVSLMALLAPAAWAQGVTVLPVTIHMAPGQQTVVLTVTSHADADTSFQVRPFTWSQSGNQDTLVATDELLASPPLGTIAAGGTQIIRMMLRKPAQGKEATYRILLDEIPPAAAPGSVRIALRLSIPIFAAPATRSTPHLQWRVESGGREAFLVAVNDGTQHETVRDIALTAAGGAVLHVESNTSPYVLAGATHRWRIVGPPQAPGASLHLSAHADSGSIDQTVAAVATP